MQSGGSKWTRTRDQMVYAINISEVLETLSDPGIGSVGLGMDLKQVGEKFLSSVRSARSLNFLSFNTDRPEVPARAVAAAAVARALTGLPPYQRLFLPSASGGLVPLYVSGTRGQTVEQLEENFYEEDFDPVRHMLEDIPLEENDLNYFEKKVAQRLAQLDVITEQLSRQVMEHHEEMVKGMQLVMELEHDLQVANVICKNGRRHLSWSMHEVSQDLVVTSNAKKKQVYLDMLPILRQLQHAVGLKSVLDSYVEEGNYGKAFQIFPEYLQLLDHFSELSAIQEMNRGIEVWWGRTLEKVESVLLRVCRTFSSESYITVVDAYVLIGDISGFAEKLQHTFMQIVLSESQTVLKDFIFQGLDSQTMQKKARLTYNDLCLQLPESKFRNCLMKTLEVLFDLMCSYFAMMMWRFPETETKDQGMQPSVSLKATDIVVTLEENQCQIKSIRHKRCGSLGSLPGVCGVYSHNSTAAFTASLSGHITSYDDSYTVSKMPIETHWISSSTDLVTDEKQKLAVSTEESGVDSADQITRKLSSKIQAPHNGSFDDSSSYMNTDSSYDQLRRDAVAFVGQALDKGRKNFWRLVTSRVSTLFSSDAVCSISTHQFLQSYECVNIFILSGEAFCGAEATEFRQKMKGLCEKYFGTFHRQTIEALRIVLEKETWQEISPETVRTVNLAGLVGDGAPLLVTYRLSPSKDPMLDSNNRSEIGKRKDLHVGFSHWFERGNPFGQKKNHIPRDYVGSSHEASVTKYCDSNFKESINHANNGSLVIEDLGNIRHGNGKNGEGGEDDDESEDLLADFIDEDSQLPSRVSNSALTRTTSSGNWKHEEIQGLTGSSVSLLRWMDKYARLMQKLETVSSVFFKGICQLFELYFYFIFKTFGQRDASSSGRVSMDFLNSKLKATLVRLTQGFQEQRIKMQIGTVAAASPNAFNNSSVQIEVAPMSPIHGSSLFTAGNYYGLKERCTAAESISRIAQILRRSRTHIQSMLPQSTLASVEDFYAHTVDSVHDLKEHIFRTTARLLLNINGYVERIANVRWELRELGMEHNGYVDLLLGEFKHYKTILDHGGINKEVQKILLEHGIDHIAETLVEGISRVKRCTNEGRALMSLDLQVLINGLQHLAPPRMKTNLQIVETYIKAYYLPETEYIHWARAHPEYSKAHVVSLINLVASMNNWKRKTRVELLEKIEAGEF